jgi:hypothetical protein
MTCSNCNKQCENGNFCSNCGHGMMKKCPECGEMEWVGRKFCGTKLKKARANQREFVENEVSIPKIINAVIAWVLALFMVGLIFFGAVTITEWIGSMIATRWKVIVVSSIILLSCSYGTLWCVIRIMKKRFDKVKQIKALANQEFFRLRPDYAEIIRQAEEEEK